MPRSIFAGVAGVGTAVMGVLCCLGVPLFLALGVGSGIVVALGLLRPAFGVLTVIFLAGGFYMLHRERTAERSNPADKASSADDRAIRRSRLALWVATGLALVLWVLPLLVGGHGGMDP